MFFIYHQNIKVMIKEQSITTVSGSKNYEGNVKLEQPEHSLQKFIVCRRRADADDEFYHKCNRAIYFYVVVTITYTMYHYGVVAVLEITYSTI